MMEIIDNLISRLQAYGFQITINNYNVGSLCNVTIWRIFKINNKFIQFFIKEEIYKRKKIFYNTYDLPRERNLLAKKLESLLMVAENS